MESRESVAARCRYKIDHARQVERILQWLGWTVVVLAAMRLIGFVGLWMAGRLSGGQAFGASLGTILGSILLGSPPTGTWRERRSARLAPARSPLPEGGEALCA
jgi:uncharacterized membrane protein YkgB